MLIKLNVLVKYKVLLASFHTFALQFIKEYLNVYKVPLGVKICDGTWNVFIGEVISR